MKVGMIVAFEIQKRNSKGWYVPMRFPEGEAVNFGGFKFACGDKTIPFNFDEFTGSQENGVWHIHTGLSSTPICVQLPVHYDERYKQMGFQREDVSPELLASVHHIEEFSVVFNDGVRVITIGDVLDNAKVDAEYKIAINEISFIDEHLTFYDVVPKVLNAFNNGQRGRSPLETQIENCAAQAGTNKVREYELTLFEGEEDEQIVRAMLTDDQVEMIRKDMAGILNSEYCITLTDGSRLEVGCIDAIEILDGDSLMPIHQATHKNEER